MSTRLQLLESETGPPAALPLQGVHVVSTGYSLLRGRLETSSSGWLKTMSMSFRHVAFVPESSHLHRESSFALCCWTDQAVPPRPCRAAKPPGKQRITAKRTLELLLSTAIVAAVEGNGDPKRCLQCFLEQALKGDDCTSSMSVKACEFWRSHQTSAPKAQEGSRAEQTIRHARCPGFQDHNDSVRPFPAQMQTGRSLRKVRAQREI